MHAYTRNLEKSIKLTLVEPSGAYVPRAHALQFEALPDEFVPIGHSRHSLAPNHAYRPAPQVVHADA
jgi:hypothetical protein